MTLVEHSSSENRGMSASHPEPNASQTAQTPALDSCAHDRIRAARRRAEHIDSHPIVVTEGMHVSWRGCTAGD
jgi:hypothetical protein